MANNEKNPSPPTPAPNHKAAHDIDPENMGEHEGATESEVSETPAPAGSDFDDEPRQG
jgi:hypothetical protein